MALPVVYFTRSETIAASHRLHSNKLSDEQNREIFGKCNNPNGHGHNYKVEVTVRGTVDPVTGMVVNLQVLKDVLAQILPTVDHHNLYTDVPYFQNVVCTVENICVYFWNEIIKRLPKSSTFELFEVKVFETEKNWAVYRGESR